MRTTTLLAAGLLALCAATAALAQEPAPPANDAELVARIRRAGTSADNGGADRVVVLKRTTVDVEPTGLAHIRERQVLKCLTEPGAAQLARLRFDYDPTSNLVEIRSVRVLRAGGAVETIPADRIVDLPQPQFMIYWGARMKLVPLPRLAPGDAVDVETYMKGFLIAYLGDAPNPSPDGAAGDDERYIPPMRGHFYDVVTFQDSVPVRERHYTVTTPKDKPIQFEVYNGEVRSFVGFEKDRLVYRFWKTEMPAWKSEPRAVAESDLAPKVVLATVPAWEDKSRWFAQVNDPQFAADDAIRAKVAELTKGAKNDDEKVAAIVHWAADNIRYSGITMGKGEGYTLHPASMIYEDRSGVCKDKAGMAIAMLRAAGFTAYPAMTMAGARVERVPADQFNHCVAALRKQDGSYQLLDPTWVPLSTELWSSAEGEQHYLIGAPEGVKLAETPKFQAADNGIHIDSTARLDETGALSGTLVITGKGIADQRLRRDLAQGSAARDRQAWVETIVQEIAPGAIVEPVAIASKDLADIGHPVRIEVRYRAPRYALVAKDRMLFVPPAAKHPMRSPAYAPYLEAAALEKREQPIQLGAPRQMEVRETLTLPAHWRVARVPKARKLDGAIAALDSTVNARPAAKDGAASLAVDYRLVVKRRVVPAEDYANFRDVVREAKDLESDLVVIEREGK